MLTGRFEDALAYATRAHAGAVRKGTEVPYVAHVLAVAALVLEHGGDEDEAIAALLHDTAEDAGGRERLDEIATRFGERVASIVEACSDTLLQPKPPWPERKAGYIARARAETDAGILRVSAADKLHNAGAILADVRELGDEAFARFGSAAAGHPTKEGHLWYLGSLGDAYRTGLPGRLSGQLDRVLEELGLLVRPDPSEPLHVQSAAGREAPEDGAAGLAFLLLDGNVLAFAGVESRAAYLRRRGS